jgi:hypothetical protein
LGQPVQLIPQFTQVKAADVPTVVTPKVAKPVTPTVPAAKSVEKLKTQYQPYGQRSTRPAALILNEPKIDVSNSAQWPQVNAVLLHFPGTVTQIRELV